MAKQLNLLAWRQTLVRRVYVVYLIVCLSNEKRYVGKGYDAELRWADHLRLAANGKGFLLHNAIRKYGPEAFTHAVLRYCETDDECLLWEVYYIRKYETFGECGYNLTVGGEGARKTLLSDPEIEEAVRAFCAAWAAAHGGRRISAIQYDTERPEGLPAGNSMPCGKTWYEVAFGRRLRYDDVSEERAAQIRAAVRKFCDEWSAAHGGKRIPVVLYNAERPVGLPAANNMPKGMTWADVVGRSRVPKANAIDDRSPCYGYGGEPCPRGGTYGPQSKSGLCHSCAKRRSWATLDPDALAQTRKNMSDARSVRG